MPVTLIYCLLFAAPLANPAVDYYDPRVGGGSLLDKSSGLGEPLNVIISGKSSPEVLTQKGFLQFAQAIGFQQECLGLHQGAAQTANLGDGRGDVPELAVIRQDFNLPGLGTCIESLVGGNHFRIFPQTGPNANSGALFLAVSREADLAHHHTIAKNGYNLGRDGLVASALHPHRIHGRTYSTTVTEIQGLLTAGANGINHGIAQDGVVKLLTVTVK
ncbi:hypothetical protein HGRIS_002168 [Hohenbuehelia grisea]|uniref:Uncharacterized protein n=1 Tax=Hohenbuehelia grisea TaxID=104357 RepID=A0ABR3JLN7_9AGAR